ncbi:MAG: glycosyltransferase [bacterium]|nr:glycosyltransferase [bacterium]
MVKSFDDSAVTAVMGAYCTRQKQLAARFAQLEFEDRYDRLAKSASIDMLATYSAAIRKDVFMQMKGFDESFPVANNEDTDLSYRLCAAGHKIVFSPAAIVYHSHPDILTKYLKIIFWRGY